MRLHENHFMTRCPRSSDPAYFCAQCPLRGGGALLAALPGMLPSTATAVANLPALALPLEIRVHGRGGQGGVTCAKLLASIYGELGLRVQTFGDYGSERAGAPVRAFTRVDTTPITNRNKVYRPHHLLVLDAGLLGDDVLDGAAPGALLLVNSARGLAVFSGRHRPFRAAAVDATA